MFRLHELGNCWLLAIACTCLVATTGSARTQDEELAQVQGKWVRTIKTDKGIGKVVKEHRGNETTVTAFDSEGQVVAAKTSEFRLEKTGKVRILTFFNSSITAGPQKGQTDKKPQSYLYRVTGDTFFEVHGLLLDDSAEPLVLTWERVKD